jgi:hypothetical protein
MSTLPHLPAIKGLFEIHITVDHTTHTGLYDLVRFTADHKDMKRILAVGWSGVWPNQYMISKWSNGTAVSVVTKAEGIAEDMRKAGIVVKRVKVESMAHNDGVPVSDNQWSDNYFEFHAKVDLGTHTLEEFEEDLGDLEHSEYTVLGTSFNLTGTSGVPLLTLRVEGQLGRAFAIAEKDLVLEQLKDDGYDILGSLQSEYAVYDTNREIDDGWLV